MHLNKRITLENNGSLFINDLQKADSGIYSCTASSKSGNTSWSAVITVSSSITNSRKFDISALPQKPSKPRIVNITSSSVTITWSPGYEKDNDIIGYQVEFFSSNSNVGWVIAANRITEDTYTV